MICPSCNRNIPDRAMYCECGHVFQVEPQQIPKATPPNLYKPSFLHDLAMLAHMGTLIGAAMAVFELSRLAIAESAPQQAAIAGMACAYVIIPYCAARAFGEIARHKENR